MATTFLCNLNERVTRHILDTCGREESDKLSGGQDELAFVALVHKFEQFVDHGFQELPMRLQKPRILSNNIHYVRSDHCFVVLSAFDFAETEQVLDDSN
jgi:hypothetical protein